jgi:nicotinate dehydrogenase subunit B
MSRPRLPWSVQENPLLCQWVDFSELGVAKVFSAKVELGQGIITALAQIAAEELGLPMRQIVVISGDTRRCPDEGYTAGSMSIEVGGNSVRIACAEARQAILERAATILGAEVSRLATDAGVILIDGNPSQLDYWQVAPQVDWKRPIRGTLVPGGAGRGTYIGKNVARLDLPDKVTGAAFIHDFELPGMLHGRVLRPPSQSARLESLDQSRAEHLPGVVTIWRSGDFVGICCEREYQAVQALEALRRAARWNEGESEFPDYRNWTECLTSLRSIDSESEVGERTVAAELRLSATYSKPPIAHASMAPSCAVAQFIRDRLTVWTHSQGVFPLRGALAHALGVDESRIDVIHVQGAGVYGHQGADDVAMDAVLLAQRVAPRPVRVQWMRDDELAWSPFGSPMVVKINGGMTTDGKIVDWSAEIWSGPYGRRPGRGAVNLLAAAHTEPAIPFPESHEVLGGFAGSARNSEPAYDLPHRRIILHSIPGLPFRTSSLRTLGGYANVFASESFMDELAHAAAADPVEFRLRHLSDPRARLVIETVARISGWKANRERGTGHGAGIGFARYKNTAAYVAVVASVEVAECVRVSKVYCAVDAGLVINPDGLINQIEGGIIQSISWTLKEQVRLTHNSVSTRSWGEYPILRFDEVPEVEVELIQAPDYTPLGVGEAAHGPTAAAVANAVTEALDFRVRDLPMTRERIISATAAKELTRLSQ